MTNVLLIGAFGDRGKPGQPLVRPTKLATLTEGIGLHTAALQKLGAEVLWPEDGNTQTFCLAETDGALMALQAGVLALRAGAPCVLWRPGSAAERPIVLRGSEPAASRAFRPMAETHEWLRQQTRLQRDHPARGLFHSEGTGAHEVDEADVLQLEQGQPGRADLVVNPLVVRLRATGTALEGIGEQEPNNNTAGYALRRLLRQALGDGGRLEVWPELEERDAARVRMLQALTASDSGGAARPGYLRLLLGGDERADWRPTFVAQQLGCGFELPVTQGGAPPRWRVVSGADLPPNAAFVARRLEVLPGRTVAAAAELGNPSGVSLPQDPFTSLPFAIEHGLWLDLATFAEVWASHDDYWRPALLKIAAAFHSAPRNSDRTLHQKYAQRTPASIRLNGFLEDVGKRLLGVAPAWIELPKPHERGKWLRLDGPRLPLPGRYLLNGLFSASAIGASPPTALPGHWEARWLGQALFGDPYHEWRLAPAMDVSAFVLGESRLGSPQALLGQGAGRGLVVTPDFVVL